MTRGGEKSIEAVTKTGAKPVKGVYTDGESLTKVIKETKVTKLFFITDFFNAAKGKMALEVQQGKAMIDAAKSKPSPPAVQVVTLRLPIYIAPRTPLLGRLWH
jgi:hypothetical protein